MNKIKPEDISDKLRDDIANKCGIRLHTGKILAVVNSFIENGITVLKPGELYWVESNLGRSPEYREWRAVGAIYEMQINDSILHEGTFNTILTELKTGHEIGDYSHPTLEAAKSYCQKLEDDAKGKA